jgi:hypothetical protein
MIVTHIAVQEANHLVTRHTIDQKISNRHRVLILWSGSV